MNSSSFSSTLGSRAGIAAALSVLAASAAEAQVVVNNTVQSSTGSVAFLGWDPIAGSSFASYTGPFIIYGCSGMMSFAYTVGDTYQEVGLTQSVLALGSDVALETSWQSRVASQGSGWVGTVGSVGNLVESGDPFYLGFRFKTSDEAAYNYGFVHLTMDYPVNGSQVAATLHGFSWNETPGGSIAVSAIPEPTTVATWFGIAAFVAVAWWRRVSRCASA